MTSSVLSFLVSVILLIISVRRGTFSSFIIPTFPKIPGICSYKERKECAHFMLDDEDVLPFIFNEILLFNHAVLINISKTQVCLSKLTLFAVCTILLQSQMKETA